MILVTIWAYVNIAGSGLHGTHDFCFKGHGKRTMLQFCCPIPGTASCKVISWRGSCPISAPSYLFGSQLKEEGLRGTRHTRVYMGTRCRSSCYVEDRNKPCLSVHSLPQEVQTLLPSLRLQNHEVSVKCSVLCQPPSRNEGNDPYHHYDCTRKSAACVYNGFGNLWKHQV